MRALAVALLSLSAPAFGQTPAEPAPEPAPITKLPELVRMEEAVYPKTALADRVAAKVNLEIDVGADGLVSGVRVVSSSTMAAATSSTSTWVAPARTATVADYGFVRSATTAAARLVFSPAEAGGVPIAVTIGFSYAFEPPPLPLPPPPVAEGELPPPAPSVLVVEGTVRERGTRRLLSGVVVTVFRGEGEEASGFEAVSDQEGRFRFFDLGPGEWKFLGEQEGYFSFRTTETLAAGEVLEPTYYLERGTYNPYDVLVEAERPKKEVTRRTLDIADIVRVPGTLGDPIQVVENLPGVARTNGGLVVVRGSGPESTGLYLDSIEVPLLYHFGGLRSVVPASVIERVDFYPGNYPVNYGRRSGGVFDASLKRVAPDQLHGSMDVSLLDAALYLEVPVTDTFAVAVAGRRSYIDAILNAVVPEDSSVALVSAPRYYDYQLLSSWRPSRAHEVRGYLLGSDDAVSILFENPADLDSQLQSGNLQFATSFQRGILEYRYAPSQRYQNDLRVAVGHDRAEFSLGDQFRFYLDLINFQMRDRADLKLSDVLTLSGGLDGAMTIADVEAQLPLPPREGEAGQGNQDATDVTFDAVSNQVSGNIAPWVEATISLFDRLTIVPGLRVDYFGLVQAFSVDPRLVVRYQLDPRWTVKAALGLTHEEPQAVDLSDTFGNPDLGLQRAVQVSAGAEWSPLAYLKLDVTLFYKDLSNLVSRTNAVVIRDGQPVELRLDNNGTGRVYGLEVFIDHQFANDFRGWLSYTLSRAERTDSGDTQARLFDFDQTHILAVVASYALPENWEASLRWRLVTGSPNTPFVSGVFQSDFDRYSPVPGPSNSERLPYFHQLDLRVDKKWVFDVWTFSVYLSLINSYNRGNVEGWSYNFDYSEREAAQGLPILPILGVTGAF